MVKIEVDDEVLFLRNLQLNIQKKRNLGDARLVSYFARFLVAKTINEMTTIAAMIAAA